MAKRKSKPSKATTSLSKTSNASGGPNHRASGPGFFPFARYTSLVCVHVLLLVFTALFLPRTTFLSQLTMSLATPSQMTSRDKPQHPFLTALTVNAASTLACICTGTIILQGWWGGWVRDWRIDSSLQGSDGQKRVERAVLDQSKLAELRRSWLATFAASFALHIALILFGSPIKSHILHTYLLALLISLLTVFTPAYSLGVPSFASDAASLRTRSTWVRLFAEFSIRSPVERAVVYPSIGALLGCWTGAFPIALDWDRPWQAWPLTPAYGAIIGHIIGSVCALTVSAILYFAEEHIHLERDLKANTE